MSEIGPKRLASRRQFLKLGGAVLAGLAAGAMGIGRREPAFTCATEHSTRPGETLAPITRGSIKGQSLTFEIQGEIKGAGDSQEMAISLASAGAGTYTSPVIRAPLPFTAVGPHWALEGGPDDTLRVEVRTSADGATWSEWQSVALETPFGSTPSPQYFGSLVSASSPDHLDHYAQYRIASASDQMKTLPPTRLTLTFIDASDGPAGGQTLAAERLAMAPSALPMPPITWRVGWGCPDGESSPNWPPEYHPVTHLVIHHTASSNSITDWAAHVRAIWYYHAITLDWGDIGYNYLVDPNGVIYEGRAGGNNVVGAHVYGFNTSGTMGVACLGTYSYVGISPALRSSLESLLAWKCTSAGLDPTGSRSITGYASCAPLTINQPVISGHRDFPGHSSAYPYACNPYGPTECPGNQLESQLPAIRADVAGRIQAAPSPGKWKLYLPLVSKP